MQERLKVGRRYVARGPNPDAAPEDATENTVGWWTPPQVKIVAVDEERECYVTAAEGRQVAPVIAFGAELHWREAEPATAVAL